MPALFAMGIPILDNARAERHPFPPARQLG